MLLLSRLTALLPAGRVGMLVVLSGSILLIHTLLRLILLIAFAPAGMAAGQLLQVFGIGLLMDVYVVLSAVFLLGGALALIPNRWLKWWGMQIAARVALALAGAISFFMIAAEYFFFEEFRSRFNTVAVDYLLYPHEVFINLWQDYPMGWIIALALLVGVGWMTLLRTLQGPEWLTATSTRTRWGVPAGALLLMAALWPAVGNRVTRFCEDRNLNEMASNGWYTFVQAAVTRELDYEPFYQTMPLEDAYARSRMLLQQSNATFATDPHSIRRHIAGDSQRPKLNVVLFLEESLGSDFFGCLGRPGETLTPELDKLADESLLFTNIYASGNRTVRGMEGVICSFPPLPGDSVVARPLNHQVETIARALKRDDYKTLFLYAGRGLFDNVREFMTANGYERLIELRDFVKPAFETIWGVSNEDLYQRALEECRQMHREGKPFLVTTLSVSNHKPFTYPKGRIPENPDEHRRDFAVKYTDYALGQFFRQARREPFWTNTIFVVVADHGARVYGRQTIPMKSYEIPLLVAGPAAAAQPARVGILGGQLDVAPTILGLIGRPYDSTFFGRDLFRIDPATGRSLLHHNRDIGLYRQGNLAVLGLNKVRQYYTGNPKTGQPQATRQPDEPLRETEVDATALFQVANDLYLRQGYMVPELPAAKAAGR
jgi:phosphoglycerol transferase MdoB-like AlkP superfamily enzyme